MVFLKYAFLETDFATAILVVEKESNALVYASLGTSRTCMLSETRSSFGKLSKKEKQKYHLIQQEDEGMELVKKRYGILLLPNVKASDLEYKFLFGTSFQRKVWNELLNVEYGRTVSYSDIAQRLGAPKAVRAVGVSCGQNKLAVIVPCHRVLNKAGKLNGYKWGLHAKKTLLQREGVQIDS